VNKLRPSGPKSAASEIGEEEGEPFRLMRQAVEATKSIEYAILGLNVLT